MKNILTYSLFCLLLLSVFNTSAQSRGGQGKHNMFGLKLGASLFDIKTDNFITTPSYGFIGGLATRGDFYNNWDIQLGMNISNNKIKIQGRENATATAEDIDFGLLNAQVQVLFGYKLIGNNRNYQSNFKLTAEIGPVLMVNSKMKLDKDSYETYLIDKANLTAEDVADINGINANGLVGLSIGAEKIRAFIHYQYGFNNILNKLNDIEGNNEDFKGNVSMFQFGALLYF